MKKTPSEVLCDTRNAGLLSTFGRHKESCLERRYLAFVRGPMFCEKPIWIFADLLNELVANTTTCKLTTFEQANRKSVGGCSTRRERPCRL